MSDASYYHYQRCAKMHYHMARYWFSRGDMLYAAELQRRAAYFSLIARRRMGIED